METLKMIQVEMGEECKVDVEFLHNALAKLPAEMYLELYHKMQNSVCGFPAYLGYANTNIYSGEKKE